jgi:hypothetical protein
MEVLMHHCLLSVLLSLAGSDAAAPTITSYDPIGVWVGTPQFTLTVNGTNFKSSAVVRWDGAALQTTFVSTSRVSAVVPASLVTTAGTHQLTVFVEGRQGGTSNALAFDVYNPPPIVASISPTSAAVFSTGVRVTVDGSQFVPGAVIRFNGSSRQTTLVSSTRLTALLSAADLSAVLTAQITVFTPGPGGGTSAASQFSVIHPPPTATLITPTQKIAGTGGFTLTVNGTNFFSGSNSTVLWNGSARTTTFVSPTQLTASIPGTDVTTVGSANVAVRTTAGKSVRTSAALTFSTTTLTGTEQLTLSPAVTLQPANLPAQTFTAVGGTGGTAFSRTCGAGRVMTGLRYRAGLVIDALVLMCRPVQSDGTLGTQLQVGAAVGGDGPYTTASCPAGEVVARTFIEYGTYVDRLQMGCNRWNPATRSWSDSSGGFFNIGEFRPLNSHSTQNCTNATQPAAGIHGRAASVIDALGVVCDEP